MASYSAPDFGNKGRPINSVKNLQRRINQQEQAERDRDVNRVMKQKLRTVEDNKAILARARAGEPMAATEIAVAIERRDKAQAWINRQLETA